jgi:hypothetical protein
MTYKIVIENEHSTEIWGPYTDKQQARDIIECYVGVIETATIKPAQPGDLYSGRPE